MMEIQPEAKPIYLIGLDTSAQYDRKRKTFKVEIFFNVYLRSTESCQIFKIEFLPNQFVLNRL